ncbi:MAG: threonylcarbamoyl-AMP synthase [Ruminococcus sp.]|nr:threonylcarbamoyl-AMP synthase [Ruminococcus sp.]
MNTLLLKENKQDIEKAAEILKNGGLVGLPTETVYGLAANALNGKSVAKIFEAKGRPMDNPLIVHIADFSDIEKYNLVSEIPKQAYKLADAFWPGPLTIIMKKSNIIPNEVSAGLSTVAIRFPSHPVAQRVIKASGVPLAAPSANLSGSPSPTTALHVINDLNGKIDAVIDGGVCDVGLESTVITLATEVPRVLRPGGITVEQLSSVLGKIDVDDAVVHKLKDGAVASSPGMKYKHYAPKSNVILLNCSDSEYIEYVNNRADDDVAALCCDEDIEHLEVCTYSLGRRNDYKAHAQNLFDMLRKIDDDGVAKTVYSRLPSIKGVGLAVYNRLIRAAGFEVIDLEKD